MKKAKSYVKNQKNKGVAYFLPHVEDILERYFLSLNISSRIFWDKLDINLLRKVFLLSLKDFFERKVTIDQLSSIALHLYHNNRSWTPFKIDSQDVELGTILGYTQELSHYQYSHKENKDSQTQKTYESFLKEINKYYERNKHFLRE